MRLLRELAMRKKTGIVYTGTRQAEFRAVVTLEKREGQVVPDQFHVDFLRTPVTDEFASDSNELLVKIKKLTGMANPVYIWNLYFEDATGSMGDDHPKGHGVATDLFAALEIVFKKFYQEKKPNLIKFTSAGPSHTKLYKLLSRKIAKAMGGEWREGGGQFIIWKK
jgi:hypothetical protein